jgi:photosystem II stability/assembly factor-like uncharacterized protein
MMRMRRGFSSRHKTTPRMRAILPPIFFLLLACPWTGSNADVPGDPWPLRLSVIRLGDVRVELARWPLEASPWIGQVRRHGVELQIRGIRALGRNTAYLFGALAVPGGPVRSLLLKTRDGGRLWTEAKPPADLSVTTELVLAPDGRCWAMDVSWMEGAGPATLHRSDDSGRNWEAVAPFPYPGQGHWATVGLRMDEHGTGSVWSERSDGAFCRFATRNRGRTWEKTRACCERDLCDFSWVNPTAVTSPAGTQWSLQIPGDGAAGHCRIHVRRRHGQETEWRTAASLPCRLRWVEGRLASAEPEAVTESFATSGGGHDGISP